MNHRVFISYRQTDSRHIAGRIFDRVAHVFGEDEIFMDVRNAALAAPLPLHIRANLKQAEIVLFIIGKDWLKELNKRARANAPDYVREELELAIDEGKIVLPILVDDAPMPVPSQVEPVISKWVNVLIESLAHSISFDHFDTDIQKLIDWLKSPRCGLSAENVITSPRLTGLIDIFPDFSDKRQKELISTAKKIQFVTSWITNFPAIEDTLAEAIRRGATVEIVILHPDEEMAQLRAAEAKIEVIQNVPQLKRLHDQLEDPAARARLEVRFHNKRPSLAVFIFDHVALCGFFVHSGRMVAAPVLEFRFDNTPDGKTRYLSKLHLEFKRLWDKAEWKLDFTKVGSKNPNDGIVPL